MRAEKGFLLRLPLAAAALPLLLALGGCGTAPKPVSDSPSGIALQPRGPLSDVAGTAQDHCRSWGLHAVPAGRQGSAEQFQCR